MMMLKRADDVPVPAESTKRAPHSIESEQALLGAIMQQNSAFERVQDILTPEHFFDPLHGRIYEAMAALLTSGKAVTLMSLKPTFENVEPIRADLSVVQYLGQLLARAPTIIHARDYAETIAESARRRLLILAGETLVNDSYEAAFDAKHSFGIIEDAEQSLFAIAEKHTDGEAVVPFDKLLDRAVKAANDAYANKGPVGNIPTGLIDLDSVINGLRKSDLIILAGRPSMGKTALATNIAYNVARDGLPVGFFSCEMSNGQLAMRMLAAAAEISASKIQKGLTSEQDIAHLTRVAKEIEATPFHIDARGGITIAQLTSRARRMARRYGIELLVVDYLQLLSGSKTDNRVQEITEITVGLKALAKELNIPVIALSQLSRGVESRDNKRPLMSDLRESGSIEQDADVIIFVYREHYYLKRSLPDISDDGYIEAKAKMEAVKGKAEAIISKDRHGPGGVVDLHFEDDLIRFGNLARSDAAMAIGGRS